MQSLKVVTPVLLSAALATLSACGSGSSQSSTGATAASGTAPAKARACILSDEGGFNDHSFMQQSFEGTKAAAGKVSAKLTAVQSSTPNDYTPNVQQLIRQKCTVIVAAGFNLVSTIRAEAPTNAATRFVMVDDNSIKSDNVKSVVYAVDQAAFLGGYAAAAYSKSGIVATYGGEKQPPVTLYMDGFWDGVQYYNRQKNKHVKVLGWDAQTQKGVFVGSFTDQNKSKTITGNLLSQNADVILPVAGSLYQGSAAAIQSSGGGATLVGVDSDLYVADPKYKSLLLVSILKNVRTTVNTVVQQTLASGKFDTQQYVGALDNGGVGLSPFHDYQSKIPSSLGAELAKIQDGIKDGSITVASPSSLVK